jgi:hypothetical protein
MRGEEKSYSSPLFLFLTRSFSYCGGLVDLKSGGLTFREQRVTITSVKRLLERLTAFSLVFFFAFGVWCVTIAAPSLSVASPMPGCAQDGSALGNLGCDRPALFCPSGSSFHLLSNSALDLLRTRDFSKNAQFPIIEVAPRGPHDKIPLEATENGSVSNSAHKVSIHLLHLVLSL